MTNHLITETPDDGDAAYDAMIDARYDGIDDDDFDGYDAAYEDIDGYEDYEPSPYDGTYSEC